jgi:spermidine synthase
VGVAYVAVGFFLALTTNHFWQTLPTLAALVFVVWLLKPVEQLPLVNPSLGFHTLAQWAGREGTVAVVEDKQGERSILMSNQYFLGGTGAKVSQERQAWLPLLLHEQPQDVAFIGLATGTTPGAALADTRVQRITAIELSPLVKEAAAQFFTSVNRGIADDSRASIVAEDGRTYLAACRGKFDVIAGDLFLPWGAGEARLFSLEHFRAVRLALKEGGIFCQWLPLYQLTPSQVETILATFQKAFPKTFLFASPANERMPVLAMVGFAGDQEVDISRMGHFEEISSFVDVPKIQALYLGKWRPTGSSVINSLGNLAIELDAGRERLTGHPGTKYLQGSRWAIYREELSKQTFP